MAGKVETMMCLMFVMRIGDSESMTDQVKNGIFFQMIQQVMQTNVQQHNYRNCSAR